MKWSRNRADATPRRSKAKIALAVLGVAVLIYGLTAYVLLPRAWTHYEHQKGLAGLTMVAHTSQDIPGDPINVGLVGTRKDVLCAMHAAGWYPADPITFRSSVEIVGSVVLRRPYDDAPVSDLYYDGRRQDLAFEKPVGESADRRHHVRFWEVLKQGDENRPVWLGSATFDRDVGLSRYTGQVTHHIGPNVDAEREGSRTTSRIPRSLKRSTRSPALGRPSWAGTGRATGTLLTVRSRSPVWFLAVTGRLKRLSN